MPEFSCTDSYNDTDHIFIHNQLCQCKCNCKKWNTEYDSCILHKQISHIKAYHTAAQKRKSWDSCINTKWYTVNPSNLYRIKPFFPSCRYKQNAKRNQPYKSAQKQPPPRCLPQLYHNACKCVCFLEKLCFPGINHDMGFTSDFRWKQRGYRSCASLQGIRCRKIKRIFRRLFLLMWIIINTPLLIFVCKWKILPLEYLCFRIGVRNGFLPDRINSILFWP